LLIAADRGSANASSKAKPPARLPTKTAQLLAVPENTLIELATDIDLVKAAALISQIRSASGSTRTALLKELAADDAACVTYNSFGQPDGITTKYCPAATLAPLSTRHGQAERAVTSIISILTNADASAQTIVPNTLGTRITVGGDLSSDIHDADRAGFADQVVRLSAFKARISADTSGGGNTATTAQCGTVYASWFAAFQLTATNMSCAAAAAAVKSSPAPASVSASTTIGMPGYTCSQALVGGREKWTCAAAADSQHSLSFYTRVS
jgi:hypothetical protein